MLAHLLRGCSSASACLVCNLFRCNNVCSCFVRGCASASACFNICFVAARMYQRFVIVVSVVCECINVCGIFARFHISIVVFECINIFTYLVHSFTNAEVCCSYLFRVCSRISPFMRTLFVVGQTELSCGCSNASVFFHTLWTVFRVYQRVVILCPSASPFSNHYSYICVI